MSFPNPGLEAAEEKENEVSILVLVDVFPEPHCRCSLCPSLPGFNPCFSGCLSRTQPPTYDEGGVSTKPELYYAGVPEAHIPLKEGAVPVKFSGLPPAAIGNSVVNIDMRGSTFLDQATLNATMTTIATHVAASVAPQAVIRSYENDERIRTVIRSRR